MHLANVEDRAAQSDGRFAVPAQGEREALRVGDFVKVIFEEEGRTGERMWLLVEAQLENGRYLGSLGNTPIVFTELKMGDMIEFGIENVCSILRV